MAKFINIESKEELTASTKLEALAYFKGKDTNITLFQIKSVVINNDEENDKPTKNAKKINKESQYTNKQESNGKAEQSTQ